MRSFIIVGYAWQIFERGAFLAPPHPWAAPKKPILNRVKDFFSKCDQIRSFLQIMSYLLKKSLMENFIFCAVISGDWGELGISNLAWMSLVKSQSVLQNTRFTTFTVLSYYRKTNRLVKISKPHTFIPRFCAWVVYCQNLLLFVQWGNFINDRWMVIPKSWWASVQIVSKTCLPDSMLSFQ